MQRPLDRLKKKVHKENLWLYILRLLDKKSYYGYEIRDVIKNKFGFWVGNVTSYKVLYLLERGGYVKSEKSGREIYYKLTKKGKEEMKAGNEFLKTA
jgi:DNA-binding PadR family transcriptional regulator